MIGLDFETYSGVDLPTHGLHQYVNADTFRVLLGAVHATNGTVHILDFIEDYDEALARLRSLIEGQLIVAHNAGFEKAVLAQMGIILPAEMFIDSAVCARGAGAAGKLEAAAPQLLEVDKIETGWSLIKKFSIPGEYQERNGNLEFDPAIRADNLEDWAEFAHYCAVDAQLSFALAIKHPLPIREREYQATTMRMNEMGWHVDLPMVETMKARYERNVEQAVHQFRIDNDEPELNLSSYPQLQQWCADRGVKAKSFDEKHVASMITSIEKRLANAKLTEAKHRGYVQVLSLLRTKQVLGGSSLKKLDTILNTVGTDGRLHDQYLHLGAGASYRTTGKGVQMQNLPRLSGGAADMLELLDQSIDWDNSKMSANLRQVFCSKDPLGQMVVGDFASVENRGLAWQAGERWKMRAFQAGQDLYKVQAGIIYGKRPEDITKDERMMGKVAELACGYGAGGEAVQAFAKNMGVELTEGQASKLVKDWRDANPRIVQYWYALDDALKAVLADQFRVSISLPHGMVVLERLEAPASLRKQTGRDQVGIVHSVRVSFQDNNDEVTFERYIHGCHIKGREIRYYKPSERKTGDLWSDEFTDPKTKMVRKHTIWGGKLAGILTQSLCREIFFDVLCQVDRKVEGYPNVDLVGQFHDELVLDWQPDVDGISLQHLKVELDVAMSTCGLEDFPLVGEIKSDYRYTK